MKQFILSLILALVASLGFAQNEGFVVNVGIIDAEADTTFKAAGQRFLAYRSEPSNTYTLDSVQAGFLVRDKAGTPFVIDSVAILTSDKYITVWATTRTGSTAAVNGPGVISHLFAGGLEPVGMEGTGYINPDVQAEVINYNLGLLSPTIGSGAPSSTPPAVGVIYIDSDSDTVYISVDTDNASGWIQVSN